MANQWLSTSICFQLSTLCSHLCRILFWHAWISSETRDEGHRQAYRHTHSLIDLSTNYISCLKCLHNYYFFLLTIARHKLPLQDMSQQCGFLCCRGAITSTALTDFPTQVQFVPASQANRSPAVPSRGLSSRPSGGLAGKHRPQPAMWPCDLQLRL